MEFGVECMPAVLGRCCEEDVRYGCEGGEEDVRYGCEGGEALIRCAGATVRRLRPDIHVAVELTTLLLTALIYDGETSTARNVYVAMEAVAPWGFMSALATLAAALDGDQETARRRLASLLTADLAPLRRPDVHVPPALCLLATAATLAGDHAAGERLRPLLEPLRPYLMQAAGDVILAARLESMFGGP